MFCVGASQVEITVRVILLDDTDLCVDVRAGSRGHVLLDEVLKHFNLIEKDYFGIRYLDEINQTQWLDVNKTLKSQVKLITGPQFTVYFGVRFYPADPCKLREEITRYQFFLQVKKDILQGRLPVSFDQSAELAALSIQSELGDYDPRRHSFGYVSEFRFVPNQTGELEERVAKLHRQVTGIVPSVAEYNYLDKVKWLEMYGVDLHPVLGEAGMEYFLGLTPTGIVIYKNKSKVGSYLWPRIVRVNFKGKTFNIRVRDKNGDENTYSFELTTKPACKHLWKCTVEHHAFFRLNHVSELSSSTSKLFSLGSKYRYSGRTEKEVMGESVQRNEPKVQRTPSKRHQRRSYESIPDGVQSDSRVSSAYFERKDLALMKVITPAPVTAKKYQNHSPKSTRSAPAPWEVDDNANVGLFTGGSVSPVSFRSEKMKFPDQPRRVPTSISENDVKRRQHHRSDSNVSEGSSRRHKHRKRTSKHRDHEHRRSKSKQKPPEELKQHFQYGLVDPSSLTDEQKRDIPYVVVESNAKPAISPYSKHRRKSPHNRYSHPEPEDVKWRGFQDDDDVGKARMSRGPPPYSVDGRNDPPPYTAVTSPPKGVILSPPRGSMSSPPSMVNSAHGVVSSPPSLVNASNPMVNSPRVVLSPPHGLVNSSAGMVNVNSPHTMVSSRSSVNSTPRSQDRSSKYDYWGTSSDYMRNRERQDVQPDVIRHGAQRHHDVRYRRSDPSAHFQHGAPLRQHRRSEEYI